MTSWQLNRVSSGDTYWIDPALYVIPTYQSWPLLAHTRTVRSYARALRLSLSLSDSPFSISPDVPNLPVISPSPPRPREVETSSLSERHRSRETRGLEADAPPVASPHYTVKSNETRHLIPSRNVLSDCPRLEQPEPPGSPARKTIRIAPYVLRISLETKFGLFRETDRAMHRRCTRECNALTCETFSP